MAQMASHQFLSSFCKDWATTEKQYYQTLSPPTPQAQYSEVLSCC